MHRRIEFPVPEPASPAPDWDTGGNRVSFQSESDACTGSEHSQWREHR